MVPLSQRGFEVFRRHGAHIALGLRQDDVGTQFAQQRGIDVKDRQAGPQRVFHLAVDLRPRLRHVDARPAADRQPLHLRRKIAFMRPADKLIEHSEGGDDFGRTRQKGDNPASRWHSANFLVPREDNFYSPARPKGSHRSRVAPQLGSESRSDSAT